MKVWEGKQVIGFLLTWGLLRSQLQRQNKAKYHFLIRYIYNTYPSSLLLPANGVAKKSDPTCPPPSPQYRDLTPDPLDMFNL